MLESHDLIIKLEQEYESGSQKNALAKLKVEADSGNSDAMLVYASLLDDYADDDPSYGQEVVSYFQSALSGGQVGAAYHLGSIYKSGVYVSADFKESKRYYKIGSDNGDYDCMVELGDIYMSESDYEKAFFFYLSAVDGGVSCNEKCLQAIIKGGLKGRKVDVFMRRLVSKSIVPIIFSIVFLVFLVFLVFWHFLF